MADKTLPLFRRSHTPGICCSRMGVAEVRGSARRNNNLLPKMDTDTFIIVTVCILLTGLFISHRICVVLQQLLLISTATCGIYIL